MSRGFVKDESWEEPVVAPRAPLPEGVPNYVTARGLQLLRDEQAELEARRQGIEADTALDDEQRRRRQSVLATRMRELVSRVATAEVVAPGIAAPDAVRFGARVTLRTTAGASVGEELKLRIVGVDEADPDQDRVAFTSPIARAVLGKKLGESARLCAAGGEETLRIEAIEYPLD
ncbi:MAG: GreA/GreB family elongation factor [Candidatus Eisenbacteria bacterium]